MRQQNNRKKEQKHSCTKSQLSTLAKYSIRYFFTGYKLRWNFFVDEKFSSLFKWLVAKEFMLARWIFTTRLLSTIQKRPLLYMNRFTYNTINLNYFTKKQKRVLIGSFGIMKIITFFAVFMHLARMCEMLYRIKNHKVHPYLIHWSSFNLIASLLLHQCSSSYFNINSSWSLMSAKNYYYDGKFCEINAICN